MPLALHDPLGKPHRWHDPVRGLRGALGDGPGTIFVSMNGIHVRRVPARPPRRRRSVTTTSDRTNSRPRTAGRPGRARLPLPVLVIPLLLFGVPWWALVVGGADWPGRV